MQRSRPVTLRLCFGDYPPFLTGNTIMFTEVLAFSAGFYAENLLLYNKQAQGSGKIPLPAGDTHKFAPVALGDIAQLAAHILTGEGPHGFSDQHRGQLMVLTG